MISEETTFRTRDGREFTDRGAAEEHDGYLDVVDACRLIWNASDAEAAAQTLVNASRENLRGLIHVLEPYT